MSDFDKEAERRRLREKYERDESRQQETARMSELLLKGATMTNRHCDDCGAPVFRYQEQEFCPNCQAGGDADADRGDAAETPNGEGVAETDGHAETAAAGSETGSDDAVAPNAAERRASAAPNPDERAVEPAATGQDRPATEGVRTGRNRTETGTGIDGVATGTESPPADSSAGTVADAREALLRAVTTHATRGRTADDPRRGREHLAAAREAAEALSALDR